MITLAFSPFAAGPQVLVRAPFFRICADSTLRGPDGSVVATYSAHGWKLGARSCREFLCSNSTFLRVSTLHGGRELLGPFDFLRVADGALFVNSRCLGTYTAIRGEANAAARWHEITLLSTAIA